MTSSLVFLFLVALSRLAILPFLTAKGIIALVVLAHADWQDMPVRLVYQQRNSQVHRVSFQDRTYHAPKKLKNDEPKLGAENGFAWYAVTFVGEAMLY